MVRFVESIGVVDARRLEGEGVVGASVGAGVAGCLVSKDIVGAGSLLGEDEGIVRDIRETWRSSRILEIRPSFVTCIHLFPAPVSSVSERNSFRHAGGRLGNPAPISVEKCWKPCRHHEKMRFSVGGLVGERQIRKVLPRGGTSRKLFHEGRRI